MNMVLIYIALCYINIIKLTSLADEIINNTNPEFINKIIGKNFHDKYLSFAILIEKSIKKEFFRNFFNLISEIKEEKYMMKHYESIKVLKGTKIVSKSKHDDVINDIEYLLLHSTENLSTFSKNQTHIRKDINRFKISKEDFNLKNLLKSPNNILVKTLCSTSFEDELLYFYFICDDSYIKNVCDPLIYRVIHNIKQFILEDMSAKDNLFSKNENCKNTKNYFSDKCYIFGFFNGQIKTNLFQLIKDSKQKLDNTNHKNFFGYYHIHNKKYPNEKSLRQCVGLQDNTEPENKNSNSEINKNYLDINLVIESFFQKEHFDSKKTDHVTFNTKDNDIIISNHRSKKSRIKIICMIKQIQKYEWSFVYSKNHKTEYISIKSFGDAFQIYAPSDIIGCNISELSLFLSGGLPFDKVKEFDITFYNNMQPFDFINFNDYKLKRSFRFVHNNCLFLNRNQFYEKIIINIYNYLKQIEYKRIEMALPITFLKYEKYDLSNGVLSNFNCEKHERLWYLRSNFYDDNNKNVYNLQIDKHLYSELDLIFRCDSGNDKIDTYIFCIQFKSSIFNEGFLHKINQDLELIKESFSSNQDIKNKNHEIKHPINLDLESIAGTLSICELKKIVDFQLEKEKKEIKIKEILITLFNKKTESYYDMEKIHSELATKIKTYTSESNKNCIYKDINIKLYTKNQKNDENDLLVENFYKNYHKLLENFSLIS